MPESKLDGETLKEIKEYILDNLPSVLDRDPRFVTYIEGIVAEKFPRRDEFARLLDEVQQSRLENAARFDKIEASQRQQAQSTSARFDALETDLRDHRRETSARFDKVEMRLTTVEEEVKSLRQEMNEGFHQVQVSIDRLGARWGIRNEQVFRRTMRAILEENFGAKVEERHIRGEQFDVVIVHNDHILVEIMASAGRTIVQRMDRKRRIYTEETGIAPKRFLVVVGSIHSQRAQQLRSAGFEVIEPEADDDSIEI